MPGYDGEGTIPRGGVREGFWQYVERVYGRRSLARFLAHGALLTLFSSFPTAGGSILRGRIYRLILGSAGRRCFLEKNLRFFNPAKLFLSDRVFLGEGSLFDAGTEAGGIFIGDDTHVARAVTLRTQKGSISIGKKVNLGAYSFIYGYGDITVGDYCLLANQVELISGTHNYDDLSLPIRFQGRSPNQIVIGEDCWIGTHAVILGGVTIGRGSIIGAGAVVHRDLPEFSIAAGVPARVLRRRSPQP